MADDGEFGWRGWETGGRSYGFPASEKVSNGGE